MTINPFSPYSHFICIICQLQTTVANDCGDKANTETNISYTHSLFIGAAPDGKPRQRLCLHDYEKANMFSEAETFKRRLPG